MFEICSNVQFTHFCTNFIRNCKQFKSVALTSRKIGAFTIATINSWFGLAISLVFSFYSDCTGTFMIFCDERNSTEFAAWMFQQRRITRRWHGIHRGVLLSRFGFKLNKRNFAPRLKTCSNTYFVIQSVDLAWIYFKFGNLSQAELARLSCIHTKIRLMCFAFVAANTSGNFRGGISLFLLFETYSRCSEFSSYTLHTYNGVQVSLSPILYEHSVHKVIMMSGFRKFATVLP